MFRRRWRTQSRRAPRIFSFLAELWRAGPRGTIIAILVLILSVIGLIVSMAIWPRHHRVYTITQREPTITTLPAPQYLPAVEWLVSYQGRDLHCLAIHGDMEGQRMTCDWVRYWAEGGPKSLS